MLLVCTWLYSFVLVCTWLYLVVLGPGWLQIAVVTGAVVQPSKQGKEGGEGRRKADIHPTNQESTQGTTKEEAGVKNTKTVANSQLPIH